MFLEPFIALYHDVLVESEIMRIKEMAGPMVGFEF